MSYILEALKKAQAERQLGTLPTIHAPQLQGRDDTVGARFKKPLWLALGLVTLAVTTLLLWRQSWQGAIPAVPLQTPASAPVSVVPPVVVPIPVPPIALTPIPVPPIALTPIPVVLVAIKPATAMVVAPGAQQHMAPRETAIPPLTTRAADPTPAPRVASLSALPAASVVAEDPVLSLRELPEPIQRQIAPLAIGGYIYSKNPADRLLLVDKVLRHEGEELGPGLTLEKLQPRSAVFNFKGYRYRVPY